MDEEARQISEMTDAELEARWKSGRPAKVSRKPPTGAEPSKNEDGPERSGSRPTRKS